MASEHEQQFPGNIRIHEKACLLLDKHLISLVLLRMPGNSLLLWIGDLKEGSDLEFNDLSLALFGSCTSLLGDNVNTDSKQLSDRIARRFNQGRPVYVSLNIKAADCSTVNVQLALEKLVNEFVGKSLI